MLRYLFVDMNAYFASVEQQARPELRHQPVGVVPVLADTTCCIATSYEAKAHGVRTGTIVAQAKKLCPNIRLVQARHSLYLEKHHQIVTAVESCLHVNEVCSIDEMWGRLMGPECEPANALTLGRRVKDAIRSQAGDYLSCSVGLAPNRFLAKVASNLQKPDGLSVISAEDLPEILHPLKLDDFPGIGRRMLRRLHRRGIYEVAQLCRLSESQMVRIWQGVLGKVWWHQLRGDDLPPAITHTRTISHSRVLPPNRRNIDAAYGVLVRLIDKAAIRMRYKRYWAKQMAIRVSRLDGPAWKRRVWLGGCQDTMMMVQAFHQLWTQKPPSGRLIRVSVVLFDLVADASMPQPLFPPEQRRLHLFQTLDKINRKHGAHTVYLGAMHESRTAAPLRIAFTSVPDPNIPD